MSSRRFTELEEKNIKTGIVATGSGQSFNLDTRQFVDMERMPSFESGKISNDRYNSSVLSPVKMLEKNSCNCMHSELGEEGSTFDEMKIQTMYKMVEDIHVSVKGKDVVKKVLYLTNKQASLFDEKAMEKCIQALDLGEPKFVIILIQSHGILSVQKMSVSQMENTAEGEFKDAFAPTELGSQDAQVTETQLNLFMKSTILPLAKQTRALIFVHGADNCCLNTSLCNIAFAEQARLGKDCPFQVIGVLNVFTVHSKAACKEKKDMSSLAAQLAKGSKAWKRGMPFVDKALEVLSTKEGWKLHRSDVTPTASRIIAFEGLDAIPSADGDDYVINVTPRIAFESQFLRYWTKKVPSIAVQGFEIRDFKRLVEFSAQKIPLLYLDSRERAFSCKRPIIAQQTALSREINAFPKLPVSKLDSLVTNDDGCLTLASRLQLIDEAIAIYESQAERFISKGILEKYNSSTIAFFHSVLRLGSDPISKESAAPTLYEKIDELERIQASNRSTKNARVPPELVSKVVKFLQTRASYLLLLSRLARVEWWLNTDIKASDSTALDLTPEATKYRDSLIKMKETMEANELLLPDSKQQAKRSEEWLEYYEIFTSPHTYSGSIHDIEDLRRVISSVAKIDRLPSSNSYEALKTLQDAWDHIEEFHNVSWQYKYITKISYYVLLAIGIIITCVTLSSEKISLGTLHGAKYILIGLSFASTAVSAYIAYMNPAIRWQQLKAAALSLESEIWAFRTRTGKYRSRMEGIGEDFDRSADEQLAEYLMSTKANVLEAADIKNTTFYSRTLFRTGHSQHPPVGRDHDSILNTFDSWEDSASAQHHTVGRTNTFKTARVNGEFALIDLIAEMSGGNSRGPGGRNIVSTKDAYYEPTRPEEYIKFRLDKAVVFYRSRIPRYSRTLKAIQVLLILGSFAVGILSLVDLEDITVAVTIAAASLSAFLEFEGTNSKILRYSFTVSALCDLKAWWNSLPQIDKSLVANIDHLVGRCEDLIQREQQAWKSTSQTVKVMNKVSKGESEKTEDKA